MSQSLISIIVTCYNYGHLIERALLSAVNQADEFVEILVIDDGSTDNTRTVVEKVIEQYPAINIFYHYQKNAGASAARNQGIDLSQGNYILFLDADDALTNNCVASLRQALQQNTDTALFLGGHISIDSSGKQKLRLPGKVVAGHEANFQNFLFKNISISHGAALIKKTALKNIRFDSALKNGEDIPFFALLLANYNAQAVNQPLVQIYKHSESLRSRNNDQVDQREDIVNSLFTSSLLPAFCQKYRKPYLIYRIGSAFKKHYRQKNSAQVRYFYHQIMKQNPFAALKPGLVFKYLISFFR